MCFFNAEGYQLHDHALGKTQSKLFNRMCCDVDTIDISLQNAATCCTQAQQNAVPHGAFPCSP